MSEASVSIRLNPFKPVEGGFPMPEGAVQVPWAPHGFILKERPQFTLDPLFHAGCYYVQDSSAMYVGHVFRKHLPEAGHLRVLDLCAAPGGKTTDLAASLRERYGDDFTLVANEVMKERVRVLDDNVARWGDPNVLVCSVDPAIFGRQLPGFFDVIVADVPCSGEGMFRKDPRAEKEWSPEVVELCAARQKRILADVWPALKQGGILVYSTCTYEKCENDDNLLWAAEELGGEIFPAEDEFPEYGVELTEYGNLLRVGKVPGEGQWAGALRRTSSQDCRRNPSLDVLRPIRNGIVKGETKGKDFIPNADWALSIRYERDSYPIVDLDRQTALKYLHRDTFVLAGAPIGFNLATYRGVPLGFVKNLGKRCNNLYPSNRRILMDVNI